MNIYSIVSNNNNNRLSKFYQHKPKCHLSNITGFQFEDVNAACLEVVPEVVGRDHQHHFTCVTFLSIELDEHVGV